MCKFSSFVDIKSVLGTFDPDDMISVCKRENNSKRDFLFVNKYQGKHVPCKPSDTLRLFEDLRTAITNDSRWNRSEKICVIGFAETATAIGAYIADNLPNKYVYYLQTTREKSNEPLLIDFKEEHSHATEQRLHGDLQKLKKCDRILFVDDEISTGNTIMNAIEQLNKIKDFKYSVASFLNLMSYTAAWNFAYKGINTHTLIRGEIKDMNRKLDIYIKENTTNYEESTIKNRKNSILVVGLEEDMYAGLLAAYQLEKDGKNVYFQASTRSPICPCDSRNYILKNRIKFPCLKDKNRKTYLYNINNYKQIIVMGENIGDSEWEKKVSKVLSPLCKCLSFCNSIHALNSETMKGGVK